MLGREKKTQKKNFDTEIASGRNLCYNKKTRDTSNGGPRVFLAKNR